MLHSFASFSQDLLSETPIALKKNRDVFQTVNVDSNLVNLFISDNIKVKAIQFNEEMKIVDSISADRPNPKTYANMIGYNSSKGSTRLFWSSNDLEEIFTQLYDFTNRKVETKKHSLVFKDEKVLQKFTENENFYILTVVKKTNVFKFHIFDKEGQYSEKVIDLSNFRFFASEYTKKTLYGMFEVNLLPFEIPFTLQKIDADNPTSLTDAAKKRKCYVTNNQLIITFDLNFDFTQVLIIDLVNFTATEKIVKKHAIAMVEFARLNSNSFYFQNKLYQIKSSQDLLYLTVKDLDDNLIKEYFTDENKPLNFKNSEIYQEGGDFGGGKRVLENTSQFIRKVNNSNSGLSCYKIGENTLITFGAVSAVQQSGVQAGLGQFGFIGALISAVAFNPTMESFNSYSNRKVVKAEGLFDKNANHLKGDLQPLAFDKIRTFVDKKKDVSSQTLFKMNSIYYLGYYDNKTANYIIRMFTD
jgi:hypothetical protein